VRRSERAAEVVALAGAADAVAAALAAAGTLYGYAARQPGARALQGRAPVYAAALPHGAARVVVRHSRHGGLLAPLTGDRFLRPTRAPLELAAAVRLAGAGVPTPEVVAYALYPAGPLLRRADVATREVTNARDLGDLLAEAAGEAAGTPTWVAPVAARLAALARAGAHHPDLNVKNVLLARRGDRLTAYVLDVDRVRFGDLGDPGVAAANAARLARSARKRRDAGLASVSDATLAVLAAATQRDAAASAPHAAPARR
jgi:3-deoxy-D-manno-octulosonic acid kinase